MGPWLQISNAVKEWSSVGTLAHTTCIPYHEWCIEHVPMESADTQGTCPDVLLSKNGSHLSW